MDENSNGESRILSLLHVINVRLRCVVDKGHKPPGSLNTFEPISKVGKEKTVSPHSAPVHPISPAVTGERDSGVFSLKHFSHGPRIPPKAEHFVPVTNTNDGVGSVAARIDNHKQPTCNVTRIVTECTQALPTVNKVVRRRCARVPSPYLNTVMKLGPRLRESTQKRSAKVNPDSPQLRTSTHPVPETVTPTLNDTKMKCVDCSQGAAGIVSRKWLEQLIAKLQHLLVTDDILCLKHCVHEAQNVGVDCKSFYSPRPQRPQSVVIADQFSPETTLARITPSVHRRHDFPIFVPVDESLPKRRLMSPSRITPEYRIGTSVPQALRSGYSEKKRRPRSQSVGRNGSTRHSNSGRDSTQMTTTAHRVPVSSALRPRILLTDANGLLKDLSAKNPSPKIHRVKDDERRFIPRCAWK
ncbi:hypothetical protein P879_02269 [Paragonimus westermani]|uniref:Uncharacterized protein n=1 Tax=Paragonimus westermani TaxID=34504 RepID=A0A8T0E0R2_9TREM|nr:hypothetical protein P879_02269 [Paragonimus westermani]